MSQRGWDDPDLIAVLKGEKPENPFFEGRETIEARLKFLGKKGLTEEAKR